MGNATSVADLDDPMRHSTTKNPSSRLLGGRKEEAELDDDSRKIIENLVSSERRYLADIEVGLIALHKVHFRT